MKKNLRIIISALLALIMVIAYIPAITVSIAKEADGESESDISSSVTDENETTETETTTDEETTAPETTTEKVQEKTTTEKAEENTRYKLNPIKRYLSTHAILSYMYSPRDDYYFVSQPSAWQKPYGFNKAYDLVSPYILLEYDYVRVYFQYEKQDYMIQMWKGQYGMVFFGGEIGVYAKPHSDEPDKLYTTYKGVDGNERPKMQITMYHDPAHRGNYQRIFTTPYEKTWWATGFKPGHLTQEEPAIELRQEGKVTFKNEELATLFTQGLKECGFEDGTGIDACTQDGKTVYYTWQNINHAESTMGVKVFTGTVAATTAFLMAPLLAPVWITALGTFGALCLLAVIVL